LAAALLASNGLWAAGDCATSSTYGCGGDPRAEAAGE
jgi:hypothetical protein